MILELAQEAGGGCPVPRALVQDPTDVREERHMLHHGFREDLLARVTVGIDELLAELSKAHLVFRRMVDGLDQKTWTVFFDTNPSFAIYTELAICGASRILVPVNADEAPAPTAVTQTTVATAAPTASDVASKRFMFPPHSKMFVASVYRYMPGETTGGGARTERRRWRHLPRRYLSTWRPSARAL